MSSTILAPPLAGNLLGSSSEHFVIAEWRDEGGPGPVRRIAPLHLHRNDDEAWYVLEGVLQVQRGDEVVEVRPGCCVLVPRGVPHTYWNAGQDVARYLLVMTPNIHQLIRGIHSMANRTPQALRELFERHNSELLE